MRGVRVCLADDLLVDPTGKGFDILEKYAMKNMKNYDELYDEHDGRELKQDPNSWTIDYMNKEMVRAKISNFSKERVDLLKRMVRYIYKDKINK